MKIKLIINPASGRKNASTVLPPILTRLAFDGDVTGADFTVTRGAGDAYEAARAVRPGEYAYILVFGGDGTLGEAAGGLIDGGGETPLALYPGGTANDYANYLNIPKGRDEFIAMLRRNKTRTVDTGTASGKTFINVAAGGMFTSSAHDTDPKNKAALGLFAYYLNGLLRLPAQLSHPIRLGFSSDEYRAEEDVLLFLVSTTTTVGGFRDIAPEASLTDGLLDVLIIRAAEHAALVLLVRDFLAGELVQNEHIAYFQTKHIDISPLGDASVPLDLDGGAHGTLPTNITSNPSALTVVVP